jgi:hypothetical protein
MGPAFGRLFEVIIEKINVMITQAEVIPIITRQFPMVATNGELSPRSIRLYPVLNNFTQYTKKAIRSHNRQEVDQCFSIAARLYHDGDQNVRSMIENTFVFCLSSFFGNDEIENEMIRSMIPDDLYDAYIQQTIKSGI